MDLNELKLRSKILPVSLEQIMGMLFWRKGQTLVLPELPEDLRTAHVLDAWYAPEYNCFMIRLCREDWEKSPPGAQLPRIGLELGQQVFTIPGKVWKRAQNSPPGEGDTVLVRTARGYFVAWWARDWNAWCHVGSRDKVKIDGSPLDTEWTQIPR